MATKYTPETLTKELYAGQTTSPMVSQDQLMTSLAGKTITPRYSRGVETQDPGLPIAGTKPTAPTTVSTSPIAKAGSTPINTPVTPAPTTTPTVPTGGYSIYAGGSAVDDGKGAIGYRDAQGNTRYFRDNTTPTPATSPTAGTPATTIPGATPQKSAYDYQKEAYANVFPEYSGAIEAITQNYTQLINEAKQQGVKNQGATRAQGAAYGLIGSPDQTTADTNVAKSTASAVGKLNTARAMELSDLISKIHTNASSLAKEQARMDEAGIQNTLAMKDKLKKESETYIEGFSKQGITADKLKEKSPDTYKNILEMTGGDENMLKAMFTLKTPEKTVLNKQVVGSTYYQTVQAPDGTVTTQNFDLGFTPPVDYAMNVDAKTGTIVWYPKQPDPNKDLSSQIIIKKYGVPAGDGTGAGGGVTGTYTPGANPVVDSWAARINSGQAKLSDITGVKNTGLKNQVVIALNALSGGKLSAVQSNIVEAKKLVDELLTAPGREAATGVPNLITNPLGFSLPSSNARDFKAKVERLNALLFLNAIPQMRGLGALTEREGSRIEAASSFTKNLGVDEATYLAELQRLKETLDSSYKNIGGDAVKGGVSTGGTEAPAERVEYPIGSGTFYNVDANGDMTPAE